MRLAIINGILLLTILFSLNFAIPSNTLAEENLTRGLSCFEIGYRYGKCAALALAGKSCNPKDDVIIPERCRSNEETKRGIEEGVKSVYGGNSKK
jgi:hypothetical protein